jgi:quinohemoprotein ethanol dehydrogenase
VYIPTSTLNTFTYAEAATFDGKSNGTARGAPPSAVQLPPAIGQAALDGTPKGALVAWDPVAQQMRWRTPGSGGIGGGAVTTAGNLVFQAINDGRLVAYSADKGEKLLEIQTGLRGGMGPQITYQIGGKQYVSVMGGTGPVAPRGGAAAAGQGAAPANPPVLPKLLTFVLEGNAPPPGAAK